MNSAENHLSQNQTPLPVNKMGVMPVTKLVITMSLPIMVSMLVQAFYYVADTLFIAHLPNSSNAVAAVTIAYAVQLLIICIMVGTGVGMNAQLSRFLGMRDQASVNKTAANSIFIGLICYIAAALFGLFFTDLYFRLQTDTPEIRKLGSEYLSICLLFSFGKIGEFVFERMLQATGKTTCSMMTQMLGAAVNLILDPLLIYTFDYGVKGAAAATVIGQISSMLFALYLNLHINKEISFSMKGFRPDFQMIRKIYSVGFPAIIMQSLQVVMLIGINTIFKTTRTPVQAALLIAVFGIFYRLQNFIYMPVFGLNNGIIPIAAFNYGADRADRIRQTVYAALKIMFCIMLAGTILLEIFPGALLEMFKADSAMLQLGIPMLRIIAAGFVFAGVNIILCGIFQALGHGFCSLAVSLLRMVVILLPLAWIGALKCTAMVWWAFVISEFCAALFSCFMFRKIGWEKGLFASSGNRL